MEIVGDTPDIPFEQLDCRKDTFKTQSVEKMTTVQLILTARKKSPMLVPFCRRQKKSKCKTYSSRTKIYLHG